MALKFDQNKKSVFLSVLLSGGTVSKACKQAGIGRTTAYDAKDSDSEFSRNWDEAILASSDELIDAARRRALDAEDGKSHTLLMFLIKGMRPEFRDNYKTETKVVHETVHDFEFSVEDQEKAMEYLRDATPEN